MNDFEFDLEAFESGLDETLARGRESFRGQYAAEITALSGLSRAEIDRITPDTTDLEIYDQLITVVKEASRVNLEQVQLKKQIIKLGEVGIQIAKKVPSLANLFV
jgi:hypothetical protein